MKKIIKILLAIIASLFVLLIAAIIIIPIAFKGPIMEKVKQEINNNLNAKLDFEDFNLSLIRTFPDLGITIDGLKIEGVNEFEGKTLLKADRIRTTIDLKSAFSGDNYEIKSIILKKPDIYIMYLPDGTANFDIAIADTTDVEEITEDTESLFVLSLKSLEVEDARFVYNDMMYDIYTALDNMNLSLTGDFTASTTFVNAALSVGALDFAMDGISYLKNGKVQGTAGFGLDMDTWKFTFTDNNFVLNNMPFGFDGFFTMNDDSSYDMDIKLITEKINFKDLLSLVPAIYMTDMEGMQTSGNVEISAFIKGKMDDEQIPAFDLKLIVDNAMFKYPELPKSVDNINIVTRINNPDGNPDNTVIDISRFDMNLGGNPVNILFNAKKPVSDPEFFASINTKIDLATLSDVMPLEDGEELFGKIKSDIYVKGKMSYLDNEEYDKFDAKGSLEINQMNYSSKDMPYKVLINNMELIFSPQYVELKNFSADVGKSDFKAHGKLDNLFAYVFKDELLTGSFNLNSNYIDVNEFMGEETAPAEDIETVKADDIASEYESVEVVEIPANIDFQLNSRFNTILYDDIEIKNLVGNIIIKESKADLSNLSMETLGSKIIMNGSYSTVNKMNPEVDFGLNISNAEFQTLRTLFSSLDTLAPILEYCYGAINTDFTLNALFDSKMELIYESINVDGYLKANNVKIKDNKTINNLADLIKNERFKDPEVKDIKINYSIKDGKVEIKPFDIKLGNSKAVASGYNTLEMLINYEIDLTIPRSELGGEANKLAENTLDEFKKLGLKTDLSDDIDFKVFITGTVNEPKISLNLKDLAKDALTDLKDQVVEEIKEKIEDVKETVKETIDEAKNEAILKAREEADRIIKEAERKRDAMIKEAEKQASEIRRVGKNTADNIRKEAKTQGDRLISQASNPLAERTAKASADKLIEEADKKANNVEREADRNANNLVNTAKSEGDNIVNTAKKQGDKLIKDAEDL